MPPPKRDRASRRPAAASSNERNPSSKTANHSNLQYSVVARPTATVLPNNISLPAGTLSTCTNITTITSATSTSSPTSRNVSNAITVNRFPLQNPEVSLFRVPISTNERTGDHAGNQDNDDVIYLYTVDSRPVQRVAEEVDLTQELEEENPEPTKKTVTKVQKTRKRKLEEEVATKKRKAIGDAEPICKLCNIHNEALKKISEDMLLGSCGHLYCAPCARKTKLSHCEICGQKILKFRKVFV